MDRLAAGTNVPAAMSPEMDHGAQPDEALQAQPIAVRGMAQG